MPRKNAPSGKARGSDTGPASSRPGAAKAATGGGGKAPRIGAGSARAKDPARPPAEPSKGSRKQAKKEPRVRADEALIASEVRYRRLFESAKDGILILNGETGAVVDVNPFLIGLLGYQREDLIGKKLWELGFLADVVASQANFAELRRKEYVRYEDLPLETADGWKIEVEFVSNVYRVDHRKVIQCNIRDITERKRVEAERARLVAIVEGSDDAIFAKSLDGRILTWNGARNACTAIRRQRPSGNRWRCWRLRISRPNWTAS